MLKNKRKRTSVIWKVSKCDLEKLIDKSVSLSKVLSYFGLKNKGHNYRTFRKRCEEDDIDLSKFKNNYGKGRISFQIPLKDVLVADSSYKRSNLKKRLLRNGMLENKCYICGHLPNWNGKSLVLVLDHINGISNDNRLDNLRMLCPNCNSQTPTFSGRNNKVTNSGRNNKVTKDTTRIKQRKVVWPDRETLKGLLWSIPTTHIAKQYGVSSNAVAKWAKFYGLAKPPRGYWAKIKR